MSKFNKSVESMSLRECDAFVKQFIKTKVMKSKTPYLCIYTVLDGYKHISVSFKKSPKGKSYKVLLRWDTLSDGWIWDTIF